MSPRLVPPASTAGGGGVNQLFGFGPGFAGSMPCSRAICRSLAAVNGQRAATSVGGTPARSSATAASMTSWRASVSALVARSYLRVARSSSPAEVSIPQRVAQQVYGMPLRKQFKKTIAQIGCAI